MALWEVSRKQYNMKSNPQQQVATAQKNQKKENAPDIISKSVFKNHCLTRLSNLADHKSFNYE